MSAPVVTRPGTVPAVPDGGGSQRGFESRSAIESELATDQVSVRRLVLRFTMAGVIALIVATVVTALFSREVGTDLAIADARRTTWVTGVGIVEPVLDDAVLDTDAAALDRLDTAIRKSVLQGSLVRVKIWDANGRIVYSDEPRLIGERFVLSEEKQQLFADPDHPAMAEISDLDSAENRFEAENRLVEVNVPVRSLGGTVLVYEAYYRYDAVTEVGRDLWRRFAPVAVGALLALELVQIPFAWRLARRLRRSQLHRERLLRHAIESSETERRRIAGDLHDGVVQDLTGVSLTLAALAKSPGGADPRVTHAAGAIRESVKSLRSLLVEIYPPNLHVEGLDTALGDLLAAFTNRGAETSLHVDLDGRTLPPATTSLLYRGAQEALRNVASHAGAMSVRVSLVADNSHVVLVVTDDGRGFDTGVLQEQQRDGHFGLRSLAELIRDAGGSLAVRSAAGRGTSVSIQLPVTNGRTGR